MSNRRAEKTNKSDFIRSMGDAPAKDIVEAAKKAGMKLSDRFVYVVRSNDKVKARRRGLPVASRRKASANAETELRRAIAELGLARARAVLEEVEAAVRGR